jgi:hypothetical protein
LVKEFYMPNVSKQKLFEAKPKEFMNDMEKRLKKKLINLLRDDGKGHRHAKYAERLERFDMQIVPLRADPMFTAAISFDRGIVFIGEGFLNDPATFYQLNVLLRHELAHNLLMHQIRMTYKLGEAAYAHMGLSKSIFSLFNIIADDEISNRKYSAEDKIIVRNMILNGRVIGGLVTEDHRESWINMSIEEMYDQLVAEIAEVQEQLLSGRSLSDIARRKKDDIISRHVVDTYIYTDIDSESDLAKVSLKDFIKNGCAIGRKRWAKNYREIAEQIFKSLEADEPDDTTVRKLLLKISKSSPVEKIDLFEDGTVELYTPEEKYIAVELLKKYKSEYAEWHDKVVSSLDELAGYELKELLDLLK